MPYYPPCVVKAIGTDRNDEPMVGLYQSVECDSLPGNLRETPSTDDLLAWW